MKQEFVDKDGKKYLLKRKRKDLSCYLDDGTLDSQITLLEELRKEYGGDAKLYYDVVGYEGYFEPYLEYNEPETDKEREKRLAKARVAKEAALKRKLKKEQEEKELLEKLWKKHGKGCLELK